MKNAPINPKINQGDSCRPIQPAKGFDVFSFLTAERRQPVFLLVGMAG
jgi:hypothetical protein